MQNSPHHRYLDDQILDDAESEVMIAMKRHNDPLSKTGKSAARVLVLDTQNTLAQLDAEISRVESLLEDLKRQRSDTAAQIRQYYSTLALHRELPSEILSTIFLECNEGDAVRIPYVLNSYAKAGETWYISQVCRKWRSVALSTPLLWRCIFIGAKTQFSVIEELMRRGGNSRITLKAYYDEFPLAFYNFVATNLSCFYELDLMGALPNMEPLLSWPAGNAESLGILKITMSSRDNYAVSEELKGIPFIEGASNLRELVVHNETLSVSSFPRLPLATISTLDLLYSHLKSDDIFTLLSHCTSIMKCKVGLNEPMILPMKSRSLMLPYLEHFTINASTNRQVGVSFPAFLADLVMPRLTSIELSGSTAGWVWPMEFTLAIARSGCLEYVKILWLSSFSEADLDVLLPAGLGIRHLELWEPRFSEKALRGLADGALLPQFVGKFNFPWIIWTEDTLDLHLDMVEKRGWKMTILLCWDYDRNSPSPAMRRIDQMYKEGKIPDPY